MWRKIALGSTLVASLLTMDANRRVGKWTEKMNECVQLFESVDILSDNNETVRRTKNVLDDTLDELKKMYQSKLGLVESLIIPDMFIITGSRTGDKFTERIAQEMEIYTYMFERNMKERYPNDSRKLQLFQGTRDLFLNADDGADGWEFELNAFLDTYTSADKLKYKLRLLTPPGGDTEKTKEALRQGGLGYLICINPNWSTDDIHRIFPSTDHYDEMGAFERQRCIIGPNNHLFSLRSLLALHAVIVRGCGKADMDIILKDALGPSTVSDELFADRVTEYHRRKNRLLEC